MIRRVGSCNNHRIQGKAENIENCTLQSVGNVLRSQGSSHGHEQTDRSFGDHKGRNHNGKASRNVGGSLRQDQCRNRSTGRGHQVDKCRAELGSLPLRCKLRHHRLQGRIDHTSDRDCHHHCCKNTTGWQSTWWVHRKKCGYPHKNKGVHSTFAQCLRHTDSPDVRIRKSGSPSQFELMIQGVIIVALFLSVIFFPWKYQNQC
mmetsp:Transcript_16168/g.37246  ORF Transcript_16168/g.37246 Transcript_16168/m.37246 type:complete len:203 (+) Transcript_16168:445-1053(+)